MKIYFKLCLIILLISSCITSFGQYQPNTKHNSGSNKIIWQAPATIKFSDTETHRFLSFTGAQNAYEDDFLPRYSKKIVLNNNEQNFSAVIVNPLYESLSDAEAALIKSQSHKKNIGTLITSQILIRNSIYIAKKKPYGVVSFIPIRTNPVTGKFEKLVSFDLSITPGVSLKSGMRSMHAYAPNSVLQSGTWYKIGIQKDGIYKLSYSFLKNMGINMTSINPQNIRIYGNGGGMLPELNSIHRPDDLIENAISFQDKNNNGIFDTTDCILFYGRGPNTWSYNSTNCPKFSHSLNLYSDSAYYFVTADLGPGKRIQTQASSTLPVTQTVSSFDDYSFHENNNVNFIQSGRQWFGEYFENTSTYNFSFSFPNIDGGAPATVKTNLASRYLTSGNATYSVSSQSGNTSIVIPSVSGSEYDDYAAILSGCYSFNPSPSNPTITVNVTKQTTDAVAWLDYIEVNARRHLAMSGVGDQLLFRDAQSIGSGNIVQYNITSSLPVQIWDVTDITNVKLQSVTNSTSLYQFVLPADTLKQFIAFTGASFNIPAASGIVANQNLHALSNKDFIIVAYPDFYQEALQLASHHENKDNLSTVVVTPQQIYNEFSSGAQDIAAIRDFVKMFYDKANSPTEMPKYLLLFGDGSYDEKSSFSSGNTNYIPTYQSVNSTIPTSSYVTDDWYGLLDVNEGLWINDAVDIGIGRFPVDTKAEAQAAVNKILNYTKTGVPSSIGTSNTCSNQASVSPFGDWRNMVCFMGDDEDQDIHISQADQEATSVDTAYNNYNIDKIYLDAYVQEATPGGDRYPGVVDAINNRVGQGALIINWTGHGGPVGLAHERIVEIPQINAWSNANKLFLMFTATCQYSEWDNPAQVSAGEDCFLNPNGAAIALFSTTRLVFSSPNFYLNLDFYQAAFTPINGKMPKLGDLYFYIKTQSGGNSENSRNFSLLGDPALTLAYPQHTVTTDSVNLKAVTSSSLDTQRAHSKQFRYFSEYLQRSVVSNNLR